VVKEVSQLGTGTVLDSLLALLLGGHPAMGAGSAISAGA